EFSGSGDVVRTWALWSLVLGASSVVALPEARSEGGGDGWHRAEVMGPGPGTVQPRTTDQTRSQPGCEQRTSDHGHLLTECLNLGKILMHPAPNPTGSRRNHQ